jgi:hypothetical protein
VWVDVQQERQRYVIVGREGAERPWKFPGLGVELAGDAEESERMGGDAVGETWQSLFLVNFYAP